MPLIIEPNEAYHASEGVSKSTLWKLYSKTPYHAAFEARKPNDALDVGTATHLAILEPDLFETKVMRGPDARRNSNDWKRVQDQADAKGCILLKPDDYDNILIMRDLAANNDILETVRNGGTIIEASGYAVDEETGLTVKCRPDIYSKGTRLVVDIKTCASASPASFQRDVGKFGYHMSHAVTSAIWPAATGLDVDGYVFVCFEKSTPPLVAVYELSPSAIAEGHASYRKALNAYAICKRDDYWPGYQDGVQQIGLRRYDHVLTEAPKDEEIQAMGDEE